MLVPLYGRSDGCALQKGAGVIIQLLAIRSALTTERPAQLTEERSSKNMSFKEMRLKFPAEWAVSSK
jgi:hypothetical protein